MLTLYTNTNNLIGDNGKPSLAIGNLKYMFNMCNLYLDKTTQELNDMFYGKTITLTLSNTPNPILKGNINKDRIFFPLKYNRYLKTQKYKPGDLIDVLKAEIETIDSPLFFTNINVKREKPEFEFQLRRVAYLKTLNYNKIGEYIPLEDGKEVDIMLRRGNQVEIEEIKACENVTNTYLQNTIVQIERYYNICAKKNNGNFNVVKRLVFSGKFSDNITEETKADIRNKNIQIIQEVNGEFIQIEL